MVLVRTPGVAEHTPEEPVASAGHGGRDAALALEEDTSFDLGAGRSWSAAVLGHIPLQASLTFLLRAEVG